MRVKFSIRNKFLLVCTSLLVLCVGAYLWLATREFTADKKSLVFDYQKSIVTNISRDMDRLVQGLRDKLQLAVFIQEGHQLKNKQFINELFVSSDEIVYVGSSRSDQKLEKEYYFNATYFQAYGVDKTFLEGQTFSERPIPFATLAEQGESIWNATANSGPPLLGYGRKVIIENEKGIPVEHFTVVALFKADRLLKSLQQGYLNEVVITTNSGHVLVHLDEKWMRSQEAFTDELLSVAKSENIAEHTMVRAYKNAGENYLGGVAQVLGGHARVLSRISERNAFNAVHRLLFRSLLFASTIVTLAFIVAIIFSRSLTRPLDDLMGGMEKVSEGDLNTQIKVQTRDELSLLAASFNRMIQDLRVSREELESVNRELESKVLARTRQLELQNQAVKEAQEALLRSTRLAAVGEVAGQAAHQVLNPLTSIISRLRKLKTRMTDERQREIELIQEIKNSWQKDYAEGGFEKLQKAWSEPSRLDPKVSLWDEDLQNIKSVSESVKKEYATLTSDADFLIGESERISRIINNFRSLSTVHGDIKPLSLYKLCDQSVKIMADLASKENIKLTMEPFSESDTVLIDEDEFIQVLTNLLRNSVQAVKSQNSQRQNDEAGFVRVSLKSCKNKIQVHVIDNGVGISKENHGKLFEKNFTTKSRLEGTGIGLSIARRLIRAFKGDIVLGQSETNTGTEFIIELPLHTAESVDRGVA